MSTKAHGGGVCGMRHVFDFHQYVNQHLTKEEWLDKQCKNAHKTYSYTHLLEAVITSAQSHLWADVLREKGWECVKTWVNGNTGNTLEMWVYVNTYVPPRTPL